MTDQLAFDGHVAVVTGEGRGLGRAHAIALADRGARVIVNDVGGALDGSGTVEDPAAEVVDIITATGGEAVVDRSSVATVQGGEAIVEAALAAFGRIDIIVNNAGILRDASFHKLSDDQLDAVLDVHLRGAVHVTRPAWKHFRDQGARSTTRGETCQHVRETDQATTAAPSPGRCSALGPGEWRGSSSGLLEAGTVPAPEDILEHLADIEHTDGFEVLPDAMAELGLLRSIVEVDASGGHSAPPPLHPRRDGT